MKQEEKEKLELLEDLKDRIEDGSITLSYIWEDGTAVKNEDLHPLQDLLDHYNILILYWLRDQIDILRDKSNFEE